MSKISARPHDHTITLIYLLKLVTHRLSLLDISEEDNYQEKTVPLQVNNRQCLRTSEIQSNYFSS